MEYMSGLMVQSIRVEYRPGDGTRASLEIRLKALRVFTAAMRFGIPREITS